jgi:hypothetical protein
MDYVMTMVKGRKLPFQSLLLALTAEFVASRYGRCLYGDIGLHLL